MLTRPNSPSDLVHFAGIGSAQSIRMVEATASDTHTAALRYQHATNERHREVADRLGALLRPDAADINPRADVVPITPR